MKRTVLIGDIVSSRQITDRALIQDRLAATLEELNNRQDPDLASPYTITLGDEFQAVFNRADTLFCDAVAILLALHPEQVRFSFGIGAIETPINPNRAIGMDGPAFYNARKGIEELKATPYLFNIAGMDASQATLVKQSLRLISHNLCKWNRNRLQVMAMLCEGLPAKEIGDRVPISNTAVYKTIDAGALQIIIQLFAEVTKLINESLEQQ